MALPPQTKYFNTTSMEFAQITDTGSDPTKQNRPVISPASLAGVDPQSLPYAKYMGEQHKNHESPNWQPANYKNGQYVLVSKMDDGSWMVHGSPGTING